MFDALQIMAAGIWPLIWKLSLSSLLVIGLLAFYFMAPPWFLPGLRKIALWLAAVITVSLVSYAVGVGDEHRRNVAKEVAASRAAYEQAGKAHDDAEVSVDSGTDGGGQSHWLRPSGRDVNDICKKCQNPPSGKL